MPPTNVTDTVHNTSAQLKDMIIQRAQDNRGHMGQG